MATDTFQSAVTVRKGVVRVRTNGHHVYEVPLQLIERWPDALQWAGQIARKSWATPLMVSDFMQTVAEEKGWI